MIQKPLAALNKYVPPVSAALEGDGVMLSLYDAYNAPLERRTDRLESLLISTTSTVGAVASCFPATAPFELALSLFASGANLVKHRAALKGETLTSIWKSSGGNLTHNASFI
jgi:hypothetical protein